MNIATKTESQLWIIQQYEGLRDSGVDDGFLHVLVELLLDLTGTLDAGGWKEDLEGQMEYVRSRVREANKIFTQG